MNNDRNAYFASKRAFDVLCSLAGMALTSPLWLFAAAGIEASDPGPVFYKAHRIGYEGKPFVMYKFRSMRRGKANESVFRGDESRIFPFGALIRKLKIDELPQLINILTGTMSVVGPRPAAADQVSVTRGGEYERINSVQAGLTGPSALYDYIYGDSIEDPEAYEKLVLPTRLKLDLAYLDRMGVGYDLKMIWWTVLCILSSALGRTPEGILRELISEAEAVKENTESHG